jgi:hypothetical protein
MVLFATHYIVRFEAVRVKVMASLSKREFLACAAAVSLAAELPGAALAQEAGAGGRRRQPVPNRLAKTTRLFKSPPGYPNAIAVAPEGLWIAEQKLSGPGAVQYHLTDPTDLHEAAWLVDWNGKLLKTVMTESRNTSGMAFGGGYIWMCANQSPEGVFQTDLNSRTVSHRQIPLGPPDNGGGCHGALWQDGKLWIASLRLHGILRVDPQTWAPEFLIPVVLPPDRSRLHGIAWDNGALWIVTGNDSKSFAEGRPGLAKYDAATGELLETVDFVPGSADPHGLAMHDGALISCDAGLHPGWRANESPTSGDIFRIDLI